MLLECTANFNFKLVEPCKPVSNYLQKNEQTTENQLTTKHKTYPKDVYRYFFLIMPAHKKSIQIWKSTNKVVFWHFDWFLSADMTRKSDFLTRHFFSRICIILSFKLFVHSLVRTLSIPVSIALVWQVKST